MAALEITTYSGYGIGPDGYPIESTTYILYCDSCGSFRISSHIPIKMLVGLVLGALTSTVVWHQTGKAIAVGHDWLLWWALLIPVDLVALWIALDYHGHKCWKCGNTHITYSDTLSYASCTGWAYDLPSDQLHKHDTVRDKWYKEVGEAFLVILFVIAIPLIVMFMFLGVGAQVAHSFLKPTLDRIRGQ